MVGRAKGIGARLTRITARGLLILAIAHLNNCPFQLSEIATVKVWMSSPLISEVDPKM